jgi:hypothetical protein
VITGSISTATAYFRRTLPAACIAVTVACFPATAAALVIQQPAGDRSSDPGIKELIQQYTTALQSLDAVAVKKVQPSIDAETLKKAFKEMRSLEVKIEDVRVLSADGTTARVSGRVTQTLTPKAGSKQTTSVTRVMRLRKSGGAWQIDGFER